MAGRPQRDALPLDDLGGRARLWCRRCGRELTHRDSRARRYGPECDPEHHPDTPPTGHVDQDPLPGT